MYLRIIIEGVEALRGHLSGAKHLQNEAVPRDNSNFFIENGKWRKRKGAPNLENTHAASGKLSKREKTKLNKVARSIPILDQHTEAKYNETETYFEAGLRKVRPYYFTFTTHAKGRWCGDKLSEVFAREFRALEPEEFYRCIQQGFVQVRKYYLLHYNNVIAFSLPKG